MDGLKNANPLILIPLIPQNALPYSILHRV